MRSARVQAKLLRKPGKEPEKQQAKLVKEPVKLRARSVRAQARRPKKPVKEPV